MTNKPSKPQELKEFEEKFQKNTKYSGMGLGTTIHVPCGFCAEPDFMVYKITDCDEALKKGAICRNCKRGIKTVFKVDQPGNKVFEMVQFCGPDAPRYIAGIRRIDCATCNDTHKMVIRHPSGEEQTVMCTSCPRPCEHCRQHQGAFCKHTPCQCKCHKEKNSGSS
jgi:hypothetical protein